MSPIEAKINHHEAKIPGPLRIPGKSPEAEVVVKETVHDDLNASNFDPA